MLDSKIPSGPIEKKWEKARFDMKLVNPANRRKHTVIIVGSGLAGAAAAASLGQQGYNVHCFCFQDSPRRAHSIAAQGGINAAKNYRNDGDSIHRLFYDTVKGGDFRAREANVYRLAQISVNIIDQCVAQGVPFAREYGGLLDTRSFGGVQVSRTFYARGQTGQQLLLGAYQALEEQIASGQREDAHAQRNAGPGGGQRQGARHRYARPGDRRDREPCGRRAWFWRRADTATFSIFPPTPRAATPRRSGARIGAARYFGNPCFTQIHPTCIPVSNENQSKLTLMSESLRNDGRVWVPKKKGDTRPPGADSRRRARLLPRAALSRVSATWFRATLPRAPRKKFATKAAASAPAARAFIWTSPMPSAAWANRSFAKSTATSSTCTRKLPERTPTKFRCAFIPRSITRWAGCGWITS